MKSDAKTILIFTDWYLPGYKAGGPITSCANLVDQLGGDFSFKIVCSDRDYLERNAYADVKTNVWVPVGKAEVNYLSPARQKLTAIRSILEEVKPDVVYLNGMFSKTFTIYPLMALRHSNTKVVIAPRGMLAPAALSIKPLKKKLFLTMAKLKGLFSKVKFHATHSNERDQIRSWFGEVPVAVVPNIPGMEQQSVLRAAHSKEKNRLQFYTVARIAPEKNIHFALECLQKVNTDISVKLDIVGEIYDRDYFERCKKMAESFREGIEVNFLGSMRKKEIAKIAAKSDFFFLPTLGENYGHAIVEALLAGVPVVISTKTPWRNLARVDLGFDLELRHGEFTELFNEIGTMSEVSYQKVFKNVRSNALAMINLDKLRIGYTNLFND